MSRGMRALGAAVAAMGMGTVVLAGTAGAADGGRPLSATLSGANEVNAVGAPTNPHGAADSGSVTLRLNPGQEQICWSFGAITLTPGDSLPTAAHVHRAPAGVAGPVVVGLFGGTTGVAAPTSYPTGTTCVHADRPLIKEIMKDPAGYYVNLHDTPHAAGAMRGQLSK